MFNDSVVPLLHRVLPRESEFVCRTLRTTGVGESIVQEKIREHLRPLVESGLDLGYCAHVGQVDVRLAASGTKAQQLVREAGSIARKQLGPHIFGEDDEELEAVIVRLLTERKQTLALAESCTGGLIANRITNVPGASKIFVAGYVCYANRAKTDMLDVDPTLIEKHGAVSAPVARALAEHARTRAGSTYALATTGIAGPSGGSPEKPVGTVYIALRAPDDIMVKKLFFPSDRENFPATIEVEQLDPRRHVERRLKALPGLEKVAAGAEEQDVDLTGIEKVNRFPHGLSQRR